MHTSIKASLVASAVVSMLACSSQQPPAASPSGVTSASVKCQGINSCKGQAECAGPGHPCGKHTSCKGQGWLTVPSAQECAARGGKVL